MQHYIHSNESMTNKEYQLFTRQVCKYSKDKAISNIVLGLKDTFTSIQNVIKNNNGERKELLIDWCGNLLFYVVRLIDELGLDLDTVIETNYSKLSKHEE